MQDSYSSSKCQVRHDQHAYTTLVVMTAYFLCRQCHHVQILLAYNTFPDVKSKFNLLLQVDAALIATGRAPFTNGLGLENVRLLHESVGLYMIVH